MATLKTSQIVKPADPTPNEIMHIAESDQIRTPLHVSTIYLYRQTTESVKDPIEILKDSLSKALVSFYPLAGRLRGIGGGRFELHCNSMGALLLEAESQLMIDDLGDFGPTEEMSILIPVVDYAATPIVEMPLLLVQLTRFACGGLGLSLGVSHVLADGQAALHFVTEWAKIARGGKCEDAPCFDRTLLQPREPVSTCSTTVEHLVLKPPTLLISHRSDKLEEREKPTGIAMLKISKEQAEKLKNKANQGLENPKRGFTKYESICAHAWRCASKARGHRSEQETAFYVVVDFRGRLDPPLPPRYFGNAIVNVPAITKAGELLSNPLSYAAGRIRAAKEKVTQEFVNSYFTCIKNLSDVSGQRLFHPVVCPQGSFYGNPSFTITSWVGLPTYGADFGWGKEIFMGPLRVGHDGRAILIQSAHGDGSYSLLLSLQVEHIDAFKKCFYEEN